MYLHLATGGSGPSAHAEDVIGLWKGRRILELGCGFGGGARCLAALLQPDIYVASDFSEGTVDAVRKRHAALPGPSLPITYKVLDGTLLHTQSGVTAGHFDV